MHLMSIRIHHEVLSLIVVASAFLPALSVALSEADTLKWNTLLKGNYGSVLGESDEYTKSLSIGKAMSTGLTQSKGTASNFSLAGTSSLRKTILLNYGEAFDTISFNLQLNSTERLVKILHIVSNPAIITSHSKRLEEPEIDPRSKSTKLAITLNHRFTGRVGNVSYLLHVTTNSRRYIVSGTYYVCGILAYLRGHEHPVSGARSEGVSFVTPNSTFLKLREGQIPLNLMYNQPGPDVSKRSLPLSKAMSTARLTVQQRRMDKGVPLITFKAFKCASLPLLQKDENGRYLFTDDACGIGFSVDDGSLILNLNDERGGTVAISIFLPHLKVNDEVFETSINVFVGDPASPKPVALIQNTSDILLDYYGSEVVSLSMYNSIRPIQKHNANSYFLDLPSGRYAEANMSKSMLVNPEQSIAFITIRPGEEDSVKKALIESSRRMSESRSANPSDTHRLSRENSRMWSHDLHMGWNDHQLSAHQLVLQNLQASQGNNSVTPLSGRNSLLAETEIAQTSFVTHNRGHFPTAATILGSTTNIVEPENGYSTSVSLARVKKEAINNFHNSLTHVMIPPSSTLVVARNIHRRVFRTRFASKELAKTQLVLRNNATGVMRLHLFLTDYSVSTFSEHKAQQIALSVAHQVSSSAPDAKATNASLTRAENHMNLLSAEYHVALSGNMTGIASHFHRNQTTAEKIAEDAYLEKNRVRIASVSVDSFSSSSSTSPSNLGETLGSSSITSASGGALITTIVLLCMIVSIPLFALCFGFLVTWRQRRQSDHSNTSSRGPIADAGAESIVAEQSATSLPTQLSDIARDSYGRAGEEGYRSFRMQREMFCDGYYGDNDTNISEPS